MTNHSSSPHRVEYLIVGAGPAGLQLAYFLEKAQRHYTVLEASDSAGSFFKKYPRHGKLISINKVYTGYDDPEINLRWDWNSLISDDPTLRLPKFSQEYFPDKEAFTGYCRAYAEQFHLKIRYNTSVTRICKRSTAHPNTHSNTHQQGNSVEKSCPKAEQFHVTDQAGNLFVADHLIVATGLSQPYVPTIPGIELAENYTTMSVDPNDFRNQRVLIIGKGNSGFETADNLVSTTSLIHVASPEPIRMAWRTKYVGHLRAVNNNFLDTYQLKSQNAVLDADVLRIERHGDEFRVTFSYTHANGEQETLTYDRVLVCTGFQFDNSLFDDSCQPRLTINDRFPAQTSEWESVNVSGLYFAGVLMHMRDFKKKQSGFIHGFRHNIQALHHILEGKYHHQSWPCEQIEASPQAITAAILARVNNSAGLWQQTGFLCDVVTINEADRTARYYRDLPRDYVHSSAFGTADYYYVVTLEFGQDVAKLPDPFSIDRVHREDVNNAEDSEFIHPIVRRYFRHLLVDELHIIEDLEAEWREPVHIEPLVGFIQKQHALSLASSPSLVPPSSSQSASSDSMPSLQPHLPAGAERLSPLTASRKRLGEYLIEAGLVNEVQIRYALAEQLKENRRLGEIVVANGWASQQTVDFFVRQLCTAPSVVQTVS
ncbi:MAG: NAD(P)-binding domain-containing protein [Cyanobacteria bacterium J06623_4]